MTPWLSPAFPNGVVHDSRLALRRDTRQPFSFFIGDAASVEGVIDGPAREPTGVLDFSGAPVRCDLRQSRLFSGLSRRYAALTHRNVACQVPPRHCLQGPR